MNAITELIDEFYGFLRQKTVLSYDEKTDWTQISTPFLGVFNDSIDIFAKRDNGKIILSDDGETLHNLELCGVSISRSAKRKEFLNSIMRNYGVTLTPGGEMIVETDDKNFPQKKLNLLSAISEANDLYVLSKHSVESVFKEEVQSYLDEQRIIYTPHFISKGSTGLEFTFDFQIAYYHTEIVIKAFNSVNKLNLPHFLFTWGDVQQVRERQSGKKVIGLAILNDSEHEIKAEYMDALSSKNTEHILWSARHKPVNVRKLKEAS